MKIFFAFLRKCRFKQQLLFLLSFLTFPKIYAASNASIWSDLNACVANPQNCFAQIQGTLNAAKTNELSIFDQFLKTYVLLKKTNQEITKILINKIKIKLASDPNNSVLIALLTQIEEKGNGKNADYAEIQMDLAKFLNEHLSTQAIQDIVRDLNQNHLITSQFTELLNSPNANTGTIASSVDDASLLKSVAADLIRTQPLDESSTVEVSKPNQIAKAASSIPQTSNGSNAANGSNTSPFSNSDNSQSETNPQALPSFPSGDVAGKLLAAAGKEVPKLAQSDVSKEASAAISGSNAQTDAKPVGNTKNQTASRSPASLDHHGGIDKATDSSTRVLPQQTGLINSNPRGNSLYSQQFHDQVRAKEIVDTFNAQKNFIKTPKLQKQLNDLISDGLYQDAAKLISDNYGEFRDDYNQLDALLNERASMTDSDQRLKNINRQIAEKIKNLNLQENNDTSDEALVNNYMNKKNELQRREAVAQKIIDENLKTPSMLDASDLKVCKDFYVAQHAVVKSILEKNDLRTADKKELCFTCASKAVSKEICESITDSWEKKKYKKDKLYQCLVAYKNVKYKYDFLKKESQKFLSSEKEYLDVKGYDKYEVANNIKSISYVSAYMNEPKKLLCDSLVDFYRHSSINQDPLVLGQKCEVVDGVPTTLYYSGKNNKHTPVYEKQSGLSSAIFKQRINNLALLLKLNVVGNGDESSKKNNVRNFLTGLRNFSVQSNSELRSKGFEFSKDAEDPTRNLYDFTFGACSKVSRHCKDYQNLLIAESSANTKQSILDKLANSSENKAVLGYLQKELVDMVCEDNGNSEVRNQNKH